MRKLIISFCLILILTGCGVQKSIETEIEMPDFKANLMVDNQIIRLNKGGFSWSVKNGLQTANVTTDFAGPYQQAQQLEAVSLPAGAEVEIRIETNPEFELIQWLDNNTLHYPTVNENKMKLPVNPGIVVYEVNAKWKEGYQSYVIKIDVQ